MNPRTLLTSEQIKELQELSLDESWGPCVPVTQADLSELLRGYAELIEAQKVIEFYANTESWNGNDSFIDSIRFDDAQPLSGSYEQFPMYGGKRARAHLAKFKREVQINKV